MTDIYDIKDLVLGYPFSLIYSFIFILFIFILYFVYKIILNNKDKTPEINDKQVIKKQIKDYNMIIKNFEDVFMESNTDIFYSGLLEILREILENKLYENISKMTFEEIWNLDLDSWLKSLIKSIYYKEYTKQVEDNRAIRFELISKVKKIVN